MTDDDERTLATYRLLRMSPPQEQAPRKPLFDSFFRLFRRPVKSNDMPPVVAMAEPIRTTPEAAAPIDAELARLRQLRADMVAAHPDHGGSRAAFIVARWRYLKAKNEQPPAAVVTRKGGK
jgi:hypothetical protein